MSYKNFVKDAENERRMKSFLAQNKLDTKLISLAENQEISSSTWKEGNHKEYDQEVKFSNNIIKTVEWKMDLKCISTGNCYVEYWCRGKDSGIKTTTADLWAQVVLSSKYRGKVRFGVWYAYDFNKIVNAKYIRDNVPGGDKWKNGLRAALGYLVKEEDLFDPKFVLAEKTMDTIKFLKKSGVEIKR